MLPKSPACVARCVGPPAAASEPRLGPTVTWAGSGPRTPTTEETVMPPRAPKICNDGSGCPNLIHGAARYCETHAPEHTWHGGFDKRRTGTTEHKARRERVLRRDKYRCKLQYPGCISTATDCDHITALADGGVDEDWNCQSACRPCHLRKASLEGHRARGHAVSLPPAAPPRRPSAPARPPAPAAPRTL